jgi:hypothetical protein
MIAPGLSTAPLRLTEVVGLKLGEFLTLELDRGE